MGQLNAVEYDCAPPSIFASKAQHQVRWEDFLNVVFGLGLMSSLVWVSMSFFIWIFNVVFWFGLQCLLWLGFNNLFKSF